MPRPALTLPLAVGRPAGQSRGRGPSRRPGRPGPAGPGAAAAPGPGPDHDDVQPEVQTVWQCAVCMSVFSKLNSVKSHLIHTSKPRAPARGLRTGGPGRGSNRRSGCGEIAAAFARRKSVAAGKFFHVSEVAIAQWSIRNSSNARFAGGMATRTMISGDRELYDSSLSALQEGQQTKVIC